MMDVEQTIALLDRTPRALNSLLRDLPEVWTSRNEGEKTWSAFDIVGHLVHLERGHWIDRVKLVLEFGENKTFDPVGRWAQIDESRGKTLAQLLDAFATLREESLEKLRALKLRPEDLLRKGQHPTLGMVTLCNVLATWATHDLTHLHQISRIMAHQYREEVGPWRAYLGVLHCNGHSEG